MEQRCQEHFDCCRQAAKVGPGSAAGLDAAAPCLLPRQSIVPCQTRSYPRGPSDSAFRLRASPVIGPKMCRSGNVPRHMSVERQAARTSSRVSDVHHAGWKARPPTTSGARGGKTSAPRRNPARQPLTLPAEEKCIDAAAKPAEQRQQREQRREGDEDRVTHRPLGP